MNHLARLIVILTEALCGLVLTSLAHANPYAATVKLQGADGSGSGVVVSSFGHVITAEHLPAKVQAEFSGVTVPLELIHEPRKNGRDEVRVYRTQVTPAELSYVNVASVAPKRGDPVFTYGFPKGERVRLSGKVKSVITGQGEWSGIWCDFPTWFGHSGGPLFNSRGEVIGLCSTSDLKTRSTWIPLTDINTSLAAANVSRELTHVQLKKMPLWAFVMPDCPPCKRFKADNAAGRFGEYDVTLFDVTTEAGWKKWADLRKALKKTTGKEPPNLVPSFYIPGRKSVVTGYPKGVRPWRRLIKLLMETLRLPLTVIEGLAGLFDSDAGTTPVPKYEKQVPPVPKKGGGDLESTEVEPPKHDAPAPSPEQDVAEDDEGGGVFWEIILVLIGSGYRGLIHKGGQA